MTEQQGLDAEILAYYEKGPEKGRLPGAAAGRLEYLRTRELLSRFLPPAPAAVLDVGRGARVYALPLAGKVIRCGWWIPYRCTSNRRGRDRPPSQRHPSLARRSATPVRSLRRKGISTR